MSTLTNRYVIDTHFSVSLCAMAKESFNLLCTNQVHPCIVNYKSQNHSQRDKNYANVSPKKIPTLPTEEMSTTQRVGGRKCA